MGVGAVLGSPEAVANQLYLYQSGLIDAATLLAPELVPELGAHIEGAMCDPETTEAALVTMARMVGGTPSLARARGLDCVLENHHAEDIALWSALDAFGAAALSPTPAIAELARTARDERTTRRLAAIARKHARRAHHPGSHLDSTSNSTESTNLRKEYSQ